MKRTNMEKVRSFFESMEESYGWNEDEVAEALQYNVVQSQVGEQCAYISAEEQEEAK